MEPIINPESDIKLNREYSLFPDSLIFMNLCLGCLNMKRREGLDVISGNRVRDNGDENEKVGWIHSMKEIKCVIKPCAMIYYFKLKKNPNTCKWIKWMPRSMFVVGFFGSFCYISVLIKMCLQHSFKQRDFKGTAVDETREET